jgi:RimJ/RimL family protein N-acetyltransferase
VTQQEAGADLRPGSHGTLVALLDQSPNIIRTARLVLRPLRADDAARVFELFGRWEVLRTLSSPPWPYRLADAEGFCRLRAQRIDGGPITSALTLDGLLIGSIDAIQKPASAVQRAAGFALGYWLGQPYWGQGYMSEAARGFIAHVFALTGEAVIYSGAFAENRASLRIQDKLGFIRDGEAMLYSTPRKAELPHVNTVLTRASFERTVAPG